MTAVRTLADNRRWLAAGTALFQDGLAGRTDDALAAGSALPGWTGRHLVAHVAANADALLNLARWAATGEETPMYSSPQQRAQDIEVGAHRSPDELRRWVAESSRRLADALVGLSPSDWSRQIRTAQGRLLPATEIPWLRAREVMVHTVDLGCGVGFGDLPADFLVALVDDVAAKRSATMDHPTLTLLSSDGHGWPVTGTGDPTELHGSVAGLAAYLTGRSGGEIHAGDAEVPSLPAWL